jgi:predicted nuclease with TOPRIM domain
MAEELRRERDVLREAAREKEKPRPAPDLAALERENQRLEKELRKLQDEIAALREDIRRLKQGTDKPPVPKPRR